MCDEAGCTETRGLQLDHIYSRHPHGQHFLLPGWISFSNMQLLCDAHHREKTDSKRYNRGSVRDKRCQMIRSALHSIEQEIYWSLKDDLSDQNIARAVREKAERLRSTPAV